MSDYRHDIEKYLKGELTPAERNALERKALHDPFLADALEGAEQIKAEDFLNDVASLQSQLATTKPVSVWMWSARIAAGLALIATSAFIVWMVMQPETTNDLAFEEKTTPSPITASDSVTPAPSVKAPPAEEKQLATGPTSSSRKDAAKESLGSLKNESKPSQPAAEEQFKNEPLVSAIASDVEKAKEGETKQAEAKADELAVTESLAMDKAANKDADLAKAKVEDDVRERSLAKKKVASAAGRAQEVPAASYKNADASTLKSNIVTGRVTSAEDGSPLPGVNVAIKGTANGTHTDADGYYKLDANNANALVYSYIGLEVKEVPLNDQPNIDVQLAQDVTQLNEVVVTAGGLTVQRRELGNQATTKEKDDAATYELVHPQTGMSAFKDYLKNNVRYPQAALAKKVEGRVTVQFTIETDGTLTNFTVLKGIGSGCDEELIRLIKEGPPWIPTKQEGKTLRDTAKVRFKFEIPK